MVLIIGIFLGQRTLITFGFDYMGLVYLIYPEESEVQKSEIYSITRNPSYLSILIMILAGTILQFSIYSILFFILMYVGFQIWIRTVEEKELIERFGEGYKSYISETPRLFPRPKSLGKFLKYLFIVKEKEKNNKKRV
jgi:protein-S-isoprenylcysteine O-methyltransferase Ste14